MDDHRLLIDLHKRADRQGPGGDAESEKALGLAMVDRTGPIKIADIGCGTGASTLFLARLPGAKITAVDFLQDFLDVLEERAERAGLSDKITTLCRSMDDLPFADEEYDLISFLSRNGNGQEARAIVDAERREIELYEKYRAYYGYGVYIARK